MNKETLLAQREDVKKQIAEKEEMKERTWAIYNQIIGQIALLRDMLQRTEKQLVELQNKSTEEVKENVENNN